MKKEINKEFVNVIFSKIERMKEGYQYYINHKREAEIIYLKNFLEENKSFFLKTLPKEKPYSSKIWCMDEPNKIHLTNVIELKYKQKHYSIEVMNGMTSNTEVIRIIGTENGIPKLDKGLTLKFMIFLSAKLENEIILKFIKHLYKEKNSD